VSVYLLATLDTKGVEAEFLRDALAALDVPVTLVDTGAVGPPAADADVSREEVFHAAGSSAEEVRRRHDRGAAVELAAAGAAAVVRQAHEDGKVSGVLGLGGSAGTTIATAAMRTLPLGVPKVMVSTLASGQVRPWVGDKDIFMLNAVVDVSGINRISRQVFTQAARAMAGMVRFTQSSSDEPAVVDESKPLVAATMFGVTTPCVEHARRILEEAGYEVLVFHATGNGGQALESLARDGLLAGVLDITTTELADELVGGILSAGPDRLTAAGQRGVPQVISVGATDMVNFGPRETVPAKFADRLLYQHNPAVTLMRTTVAESQQIGEEIGRKAAAATGPTAILLPGGGVSAIDAEGQPFEDRDARAALFESVRAACGDVPLTDSPHHINDPAFAELAARTLLVLMRQRTPAV
jgi:uncharacterized protein (UPF0261 family)